MKLRSLQLSQWRQFRDAFIIDDLDDGINLFVGPNESGKSTLVGAIQAAFFERHKTGSVASLQPWGDSSAEPAVSLQFNWQGVAWKLDKRFLGHQRCDLDVGGEHFSGDEAEGKLAELMGYRFAKKGESKPEHHGVPGLLWVRQGTIQNIQQPVEHAGEYLQSAMGKDLGAITSSSGDWLLNKVSALRGELLTKTGRETRDYKKARTELEEARLRLVDLDARVASYEEKVDALAGLQRQKEADDTQPWVAQREKATAAQGKLDGIQKLRDQQKQSRENVADCESQQQLLRDKLAGYAKSADDLQKRSAEKSRTQAQLDACIASQSSVESRQSKAQSDYREADRTLKQARQQARRTRLQDAHTQLAKTVKSQRETLDKLNGLQADLRHLHETRQAQAIDGDSLEALRKLQRSLDDLQLQKEVVATRLSWHLETGKSLTLDGQAISGEGQTLLLKAAELAIPDLGAVHLEPGGKDLADLTRNQSRLESDRDNLLTDLGVKDLAEGESRAAACAKLDGDIQRIKDRMGDLAPDGAEDLAERLRSDEQELAKLAKEIESSPPQQHDAPDETWAEQAREDAQVELKAADNALQNHKRIRGLAQQALASATKEWQRLKDELADPERKQAEQDASRQLIDLVARQATLEQEIQSRQADIDAAQPEALEDDVQRFNQSAVAMEKAARDRGSAITRLQAELETLGAQGLDDERSELAQQVERLQQRHDELTRRSQALDLLLQRLQGKRQDLTLKLQAPLQKHLGHYLDLLFPDASIHVDDNLIPTVLVRNQQRGDMRDLSYGAREQMGFISRLAYADLLREAGQPTLLILDDALVHSDATRLAHMKRVLYDAAKRHQILLFTCHPDNWNDLGVAARDLATLKVAAA